ncbi:MAG: metal-sulfur cluster assembly factor [Anaerolineales bacterium]|nr:metal-sulfur cluster assembly factor [Anaerolineales bacterium]
MQNFKFAPFMATKQQIKKMLSQVVDPELGKNIVEAGMVRNIQIEKGKVHITLALTTKDCPVKGRLHQETKAAAQAVTGVESVTVELTTMTREERLKLQNSLSPSMSMNRVGKMVAVMSGKGGSENPL